MGKAEAGSAKAIGNAIKAKGLGRLRWYCQVCEKQCRDENGFQAHCRSEPHMRKILLLGPKAGAAINDFSQQFQSEFLLLLRTRHQTNRVRANAVYNEYIQDKHHIHMNSTRWVTLSGFIQTLGKEGIVHVDEDEKGLWITWVDTRPETLARQAAAQKKDRATMDGEERERKMLEEQISRAKLQLEVNGQGDQSKGLEKKEGEKISLNLFGNNTPPQRQDSGDGDKDNSNGEEKKVQVQVSTKPSGFSIFSTPSSTKPIAINPLKRPAPMNVFKSAKQSKTGSESREDAQGGKKTMSEVERLMKEDQARKSSKPMGYRGMGPSRGGR
ncbi:DNA/RNA-binding protein KIN17 [Kwoniella mangroviensis CBS 8886]|nr:DNA/RNA-binding protein KIN17 [Kwoniella mangroviensis CBS 8886]